MQKDGLIIYQEANKKFPTAQISKMFWTADKLESFEPTIDSVNVEKEEKFEQSKGKGDDWTTQIEVVEVCVPKKGYEVFFKAEMEKKANWSFDEAMKL